MRSADIKIGTIATMMVLLQAMVNTSNESLITTICIYRTRKVVGGRFSLLTYDGKEIGNAYL
jgi:hypothetical protein